VIKRRPPLIFGLLAPFIVCVITLIFVGREKGWIIGGITSALFFSVSVIMWLLRIEKYPDDPWKGRL